jgi:hypothetical protein
MSVPEWNSFFFATPNQMQTFIYVWPQNVKVYDDGTLIQILRFWTLSTVLFLFKIPSVGDLILSPSPGKTYSV